MTRRCWPLRVFSVEDEAPLVKIFKQIKRGKTIIKPILYPSSELIVSHRQQMLEMFLGPFHVSAQIFIVAIPLRFILPRDFNVAVRSRQDGPIVVATNLPLYYASWWNVKLLWCKQDSCCLSCLASKIVTMANKLDWFLRQVNCLLTTQIFYSNYLFSQPLTRPQHSQPENVFV